MSESVLQKKENVEWSIIQPEMVYTHPEGERGKGINNTKKINLNLIMA